VRFGWRLGRDRVVYWGTVGGYGWGGEGGGLQRFDGAKRAPCFFCSAAGGGTSLSAAHVATLNDTRKNREACVKGRRMFAAIACAVCLLFFVGAEAAKPAGGINQDRQHCVWLLLFTGLLV